MIKIRFTPLNCRKANLIGLSIIEFLIYISILAIAIGAIGLTLSNIFRIGGRTDVVQEVSHNGWFAMERMGQLIKEASDFSIEDGKKLNLNLKNGKSVSLYVFEENGRKKLKIKENNDEIDLTTDKVNVDNLFFKEIAGENDFVKSIKVEMEISFYNPRSLPEYNFKSFFTSSFSLRD